MEISRRKFLAISGTAVFTATLLTKLGLKTEMVEPEIESGAEPVVVPDLRVRYAQESFTICPYCSVGCAAICWVEDGEVISIDGFPDSPLNEGTLCSKGAAIYNLRNIYDPDSGKAVLNPKRLTKVLYRAPGATDWEEKSWQWALEKIAGRVKEVRDATFEQKDENDITVNRTLALMHLGSAAIDNEENYLVIKLMRSLGLVNIEHHARL